MIRNFGDVRVSAKFHLDSKEGLLQKGGEPLSGNSLSAARPAHCRLSFAMKAPGDMFLKPSSSPERLRCRHPSNSHLAKGEIEAVRKED